MATIHTERGASASEVAAILKRPNHTRLVTSEIRLTRTQAANAPPEPTTTAMPTSARTRLSVVKSPASRRERPPVKSCGR